MRYALALLIIIATGCSGPTRTAGTSGVAKDNLAVLTIDQLPEMAHIRIRSVQFDGQGEEYTLSKTHDFYLTPGDHTASFTLTAIIPGIGGKFVPASALNLPGPKEIPLGAFEAGKEYEFASTEDGFANILQSGQLSLVHEKAK